MRYIENIVIGYPIYQLRELISDGTDADYEQAYEKTYFTHKRNLAAILKGIEVVQSVNEVRRNKPEYCKELEKAKHWDGYTEEDVDRLMSLPDTSEWIHTIDKRRFFATFTAKDVVRCSKCGNTLDMDGVNAGRGDANFCPNCGKKMKDGGRVNDRRLRSHSRVS